MVEPGKLDPTKGQLKQATRNVTRTSNLLRFD